MQMRKRGYYCSAFMVGLTITALAQGHAAQPLAVQQEAAPDPVLAARFAAVQRHVDAYRSGDLDRFVATFTPDAEVRANGMIARGHNEIRALYALNFQPGAPGIRVTESGVSGNKVVLSVAYVQDTGEEVCCSLSEYEVRNGRISFLSASG